MGRSTTIEDIIGRVARDVDLPLSQASTIDRVIEILVSYARWSQESKVDLRKVIAKKQYKGNDPHVMLLLYDVLGGKSQRSLVYGIQAFEAFGRDPKKLVTLENPDRLIEYVIPTAESLEELVELEDTLLIEGHFYPQETGYAFEQVVNARKQLVNSVLLVANGIAYRLRDVDVRKPTKEEIDAMEPSELSELTKQWNIRLKAHEAIVLAYQAKGKRVVNKEALESLAAYESLAGTYQAHGFAMELMEAYAKTKYVANKLSTGEVPEELKAEYNWTAAFHSGTPNWDQWFRHQLFGSKEPEWKKWERQREEAKRSGRARTDEFAEKIEILLRDPWSYYSNELELLGLTKDMSYQEAKSVFRKGVLARRLSFIRQDVGTSQYKAATKETVAFLDAWNKVEPLYLQNQKP